MQSTASSMAIFAHELREPLASILLAVQAAGETVSNDQTNREMWGVVERQSHYLACIIERVMELGRGSQGKATLSKERFDLGAIIMNAVEAVKPLLLSRAHQLTVALPPTPVFLLADALRVQQVVINLLANAAKYTERGGRITVGLKVVNDLVMIEVRDSGVGISPRLASACVRSVSARRETMREQITRHGDRTRAGEIPRGTAWRDDQRAQRRHRCRLDFRGHLAASQTGGWQATSGCFGTRRGVCSGACLGGQRDARRLSQF